MSFFSQSPYCRLPNTLANIDRSTLRVLLSHGFGCHACGWTLRSVPCGSRCLPADHQATILTLQFGRDFHVKRQQLLWTVTAHLNQSLLRLLKSFRCCGEPVRSIRIPSPNSLAFGATARPMSRWPIASVTLEHTRMLPPSSLHQRCW